MERLLCLIIGYVFGMFQTGFIYGKINHIDIREHGSGNAGTTNALRTLGWKAGFITFAGDILKAVLASLVVRLIFRNTHTDSMTLLYFIPESVRFSVIIFLFTYILRAAKELRQLRALSCHSDAGSSICSDLWHSCSHFL